MTEARQLISANTTSSRISIKLFLIRGIRRMIDTLHDTTRGRFGMVNVGEMGPDLKN